MSAIINVADISKVFKIYNSSLDRVREALSIRRKKHHIDFFALKDINFSVPRGQSLGLVGVNGSGKSTLLQLIAGVLTPSTGNIKVAGKLASILELGTGFNPEFTGLDNIKFHCELMEVPATRRVSIIEQIIAFADIGEFINLPVRTYSSGMYVRLAFSAAIMVDPDVLIVDEALAVGDIRFQNKCLRKIREFRDSGKSLLFVSHDAGAVKNLCDRAILLNKGQIVYDGAPDEVIKYFNNLLAIEDLQPQGNSNSLVKRSGNGKAQINSVNMFNSHGVATDTFTSGEYVTLKIDVDVFHDLESPTVGFSFHDRLGNEIFGINNFLINENLGFWKKGERRSVVYKIELMLGQNIYNVSASCHPQDTHLVENYDWINDAFVFKVVPSFDLKFVGYTYLKSSLLSVENLQKTPASHNCTIHEK